MWFGVASSVKWLVRTSAHAGRDEPARPQQIIRRGRKRRPQQVRDAFILYNSFPSVPFGSKANAGKAGRRTRSYHENPASAKVNRLGGSIRGGMSGRHKMRGSRWERR